MKCWCSPDARSLSPRREVGITLRPHVPGCLCSKAILRSSQEIPASTSSALPEAGSLTGALFMRSKVHSGCAGRGLRRHTANASLFHAHWRSPCLCANVPPQYESCPSRSDGTISSPAECIYAVAPLLPRPVLDLPRPFVLRSRKNFSRLGVRIAAHDARTDGPRSTPTSPLRASLLQLI